MMKTFKMIAVLIAALIAVGYLEDGQDQRAAQAAKMNKVKLVQETRAQYRDAGHEIWREINVDNVDQFPLIKK